MPILAALNVPTQSLKTAVFLYYYLIDSGRSSAIEDFLESQFLGSGSRMPVIKAMTITPIAQKCSGNQEKEKNFKNRENISKSLYSKAILMVIHVLSYPHDWYILRK